jgi:hypothetical protein
MAAGETDSYIKPFIGWESEDKPFFIFSGKNEEIVCELCLSDMETVIIPEKYPNYSGVSRSYSGVVTAIGAGCFDCCPSVKKIIIPSSVVSFGENCFRGAKKLEKIVCEGADDEEDIVLKTKNKLTALVTLKSSYEFDEGIKLIGNKALAGCPKLKSVTLHAGIKLLNDALCGCKPLKRVVLAEGVKKINVTALKKAGIKELVLADGRVIKFTDISSYDRIEQSNGTVDFNG